MKKIMFVLVSMLCFTACGDPEDLEDPTPDPIEDINKFDSYYLMTMEGEVQFEDPTRVVYHGSLDTALMSAYKSEIIKAFESNGAITYNEENGFTYWTDDIEHIPSNRRVMIADSTITIECTFKIIDYKGCEPEVPFDGVVIKGDSITYDQLLDEIDNHSCYSEEEFRKIKSLFPSSSLRYINGIPGSTPGYGRVKRILYHGRQVDIKYCDID
ncbi:MAG: hypothetical protein MJZ30_10525 [Paludibacteraceae bacterium]|nr:hypothetical protein [Paludibacteraceae bacterium]